MANNPNLSEDGKNTQFNNRTGIELASNGKKGGIASGKARRLNARIAKAIKYRDNQNLKQDKIDFRKAWKLRHRQVGKDNIEEFREDLRVLIEKIRMIQDCGQDVFNIISIADDPVLMKTKPEVVIKAQSELWDREEGKPQQSIVTTGSSSIIREKVAFTQKQMEDMKAKMHREFDEED